MAGFGIAVLKQAQEAGLTVWLDGSDLKVKGHGERTPQTRAVVESLKEHKEEVITYLRQENFADWMERLMNRTDY